MKKIILFVFLVCFLSGCAIISPPQAQVNNIRLGMTKQEVLGNLKSGYGIAKSASARQLGNGSLEESIELTEFYDKYTFVFVDGLLKEWYTIDVRTTIPPTPTIIQTAPSSTETK